MFLFGLTADQMAASRGWYRPVLHHDNEPETRVAPDLIFSAHFRNGTGPLRAAPGNTVNRRNTYMHLLDFKSYVQRLGDLHADQDAGARKAVSKAAVSGKFSSDHTIAENAANIWEVSPC